MTSITHDPSMRFDSAEQSLAPEQSIQKHNTTRSPSGPPLSTALRIFGACAVIASISLFLIEGWTEGNDLNRYMKLLAQTGLITGAGIFLSFIVKEAKGARVFFGLGLVSAVANFTILGALGYSMYQLDGALGDYPSILRWQVVSVGEFIPLALGALALLSLLCLFSFSIFARQAASKLTVSFLAINALLLVPAREASFVAVLAVVALFAATQITLDVIKSKKMPLTPEAKYALACLFLPGIIIITRALGLYAVNELVLLTLFSLLYYVIRSISMMMSTDSPQQKFLSFTQYICGMVIGCLIASLLPSQFEQFGALVFSAIIIAATLDQVIIRSLENSTFSRALISVTSFSVIAINVIVAAESNSLIVKIMSLSAIAATLLMTNTFAKTIKNLRASQIACMAGVAITSILIAIETVNLLNVGAWVLIGGLGSSLIILASLYERYGAKFKLPSSNQAA